MRHNNPAIVQFLIVGSLIDCPRTRSYDGIITSLTHLSGTLCGVKDSHLVCQGRITRSAPSNDPLLSNLHSVAIAEHHVCVLRDDRNMYCATRSLSTQDIEPDFQLISADVIEISASLTRVCFATSMGIGCLGSDPCAPNASSGVYMLSGSAGIHGLSVSATTVCGLRSSGAAFCWGINSGQKLTQNAGDYQCLAGIQVFDNCSLIVDADNYICCADLPERRIYCRGSISWLDRHGDSTEYADLRLSNNDEPVQLHAGFYAVCARMRSGLVRCWGIPVPGTRRRDGTVLFNGRSSFMLTHHGGICVVVSSREVYCIGDDPVDIDNVSPRVLRDWGSIWM